MWWPVFHTTDGLWLSSKFVAPGQRLSNVLSIFQFLTLGLNPGPKFTKWGDDLLSTLIYHPTTFQPDRANGLRDMRHQSFFCITKVFSTFWPRRLTLGQSSPKGEMTWWTPRSTTLQNFIALCQPMPGTSVKQISCRQTEKQKN